MTIFDITAESTTTADTFSVAETCESFWTTVTDHNGPAPISFDRCVDWLLDLYNDTTNDQLRMLISEVLDDLRELGPVEGEFEDVVLGALASVEAAFEMIEGVSAR